MVDTELSTAEAWAQLREVASELQLLKQARSRLSSRDPIGKRNIAHLSVSIRERTKEHEALRQLLKARGEDIRG